jgi:hypothetical protein
VTATGSAAVEGSGAGEDWAAAATGTVKSMGSADHQTNLVRNALPPALECLYLDRAYRTSG